MAAFLAPLGRSYRERDALAHLVSQGVGRGRPSSYATVGNCLWKNPPAELKLCRLDEDQVIGKRRAGEKKPWLPKTLIEASKILTLLQRAAKWLNLAIFPEIFPDLTSETM